jgi:mRNA interferase YafQ
MMMKSFKTVAKMEKDLKRIKKRSYDMDKLDKVVKKLRLGETLDPKYKNHKLEGDWGDCWGLHIEPDWVLIYNFDDDCVYLKRTGTHADLYG